MGQYQYLGQQWTPICGATCICDAVLNENCILKWCSYVVWDKLLSSSLHCCADLYLLALLVQSSWDSIGWWCWHWCPSCVTSLYFPVMSHGMPGQGAVRRTPRTLNLRLNENVSQAGKSRYKMSIHIKCWINVGRHYRFLRTVPGELTEGCTVWHFWRSFWSILN